METIQKTKNNGSIHKEVRSFIQSVINQRKILLNKEKSFTNMSATLDNIEYLQRHLSFYPFKSDYSIAVFFMAHRDRIYSILPGEKSGNHKYRLEQYQYYLSICKSIIDQHQ